MLASYGIARIIQTFPNIALPPGETAEESRTERQSSHSYPIQCRRLQGCHWLILYIESSLKQREMADP